MLGDPPIHLLLQPDHGGIENSIESLPGRLMIYTWTSLVWQEHDSLATLQTRQREMLHSGGGA
jgi:hypothetical protein